MNQERERERQQEREEKRVVAPAAHVAKAEGPGCCALAAAAWPGCAAGADVGGQRWPLATLRRREEVVKGGEVLGLRMMKVVIGGCYDGLLVKLVVMVVVKLKEVKSGGDLEVVEEDGSGGGGSDEHVGGRREGNGMVEMNGGEGDGGGCWGVWRTRRGKW